VMSLSADETSLLLDEVGHGDTKARNRSIKASSALLLLAPLAIIGSLVFLASPGHETTRYESLGTVSRMPEIKCSNDFERRTGVKIGQGFLKWKYLVAVGKPTLIEVVDDMGLEMSSHVWSTVTGGLELSAHGSSVEFTFESPGYHEVKLKAIVGSARGLAEEVHFSFEVMAKFVRQEIRMLTDDEREEFFDTLMTIYMVNQTQGEAMYGRKYRSMERLVAEHLEGAADIACDHWHDDAGIMTHHIGFTLEMEQSLQSVNKYMTIPYWDYTQDAWPALTDWEESVIFQPEWFGVASPESEDHVITEGRFAYLKVTKGAKNSGIRNPYDLLRSPWNTNPVPYLMRHDHVFNQKNGGWQIPGCKHFKEAWENDDSISELFSDLNGFLHGPVHIMIGGQWSYDGDHWNVSHTQGGNYLLASKWLWRQGYLRCPESCSDDAPAHLCTCSCPAELRSHFADSKTFLNATGLFDMTNGMLTRDTILDMEFNTSAMTDVYDDIVHLLCHVGHAGEMYTSAAPWDPTFWSLHGLADRFLMLRRIYGNITALNETWGYTHLTKSTGGAPSDTHMVCDWSNVSGMELPTCTLGSCSGHHEHDVLPMSNFLNMNETYTNRQFYDFMHPLNDDLPYTYDTFDFWPMCKALNISFWSDDDA